MLEMMDKVEQRSCIVSGLGSWSVVSQAHLSDILLQNFENLHSQ